MRREHPSGPERLRPLDFERVRADAPVVVEVRVVDMQAGIGGLDVLRVADVHSHCWRRSGRFSRIEPTLT